MSAAFSCLSLEALAKWDYNNFMFSSPKKNILEFGILAGHRVVDLGSGSGHYVLSAARLVGPVGHVYAVDINESALIRTQREAKEQGFENVDVMLADAEGDVGTHLQSGLADTVILSNLLFQLENPTKAVSEARRILKPRGTAAVVDWVGKFPSDEAMKIFTDNGFEFVRKFDAGDEHYGLIFRK